MPVATRRIVLQFTSRIPRPLQLLLIASLGFCAVGACTIESSGSVECVVSEDCTGSLVCQAGVCTTAGAVDGGGDLYDGGDDDDTGDDDVSADTAEDAPEDGADGDTGECPGELGTLEHCSECGDFCDDLPGATPYCSESETCAYDCDEDRLDIDGLGENGCECDYLDPAGPCPYGDCEGREEFEDCDVTARLIHVDTGADDGGDGSEDTPFNDIQEAIDAVTLIRDIVLITEGTYELEGASLVVDSNITVWLMGDYDGDWVRGTGNTIIQGATPILRIEEGSRLIAAELDLFPADGRSAERGGSSGESSIGIHAIRAEASFRNVTIDVGDGGDGAPGVPGVSGASLGEPNVGTDGIDQRDCAGQGDECTQNLGSAGGEATVCDGTTIVASPGGFGGNGQFGESPAQDGTRGFPIFGGGPGTVDGDPNGNMVDPANAGGDGIGGGPLGYIRADMWHAAPGARGARGDNGVGGGGGAGFGGDGDLVAFASGGGGGGGGCGGVGGGAGGGGGGSIGALLIDSFVLMDGGALRVGSGGNGGDGAIGGPGGDGADGGRGGRGEGEPENAGNGADGANGGQGGYGGGGAGGLSVPALLVGDSDVEATRDPMLIYGTPGTGGRGSLVVPPADPWSNGSDGFADVAYHFLSVDLGEATGDCPRGSIQVDGTLCMSSVEASHPLATEDEVIPDAADYLPQAMTAHGVMPWNGVTFGEALEYCARGAGVLCPIDALLTVCSGDGDRTYPYGDNYATQRCNDSSSGAGEPVATANFDDCSLPGAPIWDLAGNLEEWGIPTTLLLLQLFGGDYERGSDLARCGVSSSQTLLNLEMTDETNGFRCCSELDLLNETEFANDDR